MTLGELNALDRRAFVKALGWVFEASPWVADRAWDRLPFSSLDQLHLVMTAIVREATKDEQLALLRAHPDLGTRARVSDASSGEQRGAGLDRLTPDEFVLLQRLNDEYRRRFDFPFLFAVKGCTKHDVLAALDARRSQPWADEFAEALHQVYKIARFRLEDLIDSLPPEEARGTTR